MRASACILGPMTLGKVRNSLAANCGPLSETILSGTAYLYMRSTSEKLE